MFQVFLQSIKFQAEKQKEKIYKIEHALKKMIIYIS